MNWEERLGKWTDKMELAADKTVDFASAEIPEYIREVLAWEFYGGLFWCICYGLLFLVSITISVLCFRTFKKSAFDPDECPAAVVVLTICSLLSVMFGMFTTFSVRDTIKVKVAPRVVIVEKIQDLAKGRR